MVDKIGIAMVVIGLIAILIEVGLIVPRAIRLNRLLSVLIEAIDEARLAIESDLAQISASGRETHLLWKPYRRILRWLSHPLTVALFASYRRRRTSNGTG